MSRVALVARGRASLGSLVVLAALWSGAMSAAAQPAYSLTDLATLQQGNANVIRGPNSQGLAVGGGRLITEQGGRRGLVFEGGRTAQVPGLSGEDATLFRINDNGTFVGSSNTATAVRAIAGSRGGQVRELPPLSGDSASVAFGINLQGHAVGISSGAVGQRPVLWNAAGTPSALPAVPGSTIGRANDINARGDVVGLATTAAGDQPVLWPGGQAARELQLVGGDSTGEARAVNARGESVGYSADATGTVRHATLWSATGAVTSLGAFAGGEFSEAYGISDSGAVVGAATSSAGRRAFLWTQARGLQDLNTLVPPSHVVLTKAVGINNAGAIVAIGHQGPPGGHTQPDDQAVHDLPVRVFLLQPVGGAGGAPAGGAAAGAVGGAQ